MKEYLEQRLNELNERWKETYQRYSKTSNEYLKNHHFAELKRIEGQIDEVKITLIVLEKKEVK